LELIGESAYVYFLFPNFWVKTLAVLIVGFQTALFYVLWKDSQDDEDVATNVQFGGGIDEKWVGTMSASFVLGLKLLPQFGQGIELMWKGGNNRWFLIFWVGFVMFAVDALCVWLGITISLKQSNVTGVIVRVTAATWIESLDEQMYKVVEYYSRPAWYKSMCDIIKERYSENAEPLTDEEISKLGEMLSAPLSDDEIKKLRAVVSAPLTDDEIKELRAMLSSPVN